MDAGLHCLKLKGESNNAEGKALLHASRVLI